MFDSHLIPGRKKVHGKTPVFDLTQSGLQISTNAPLNKLNAITRYLTEEGHQKILDFGAGRLRNYNHLAKKRSLEVWFTEFKAVHSHELKRRQLKNSRALAEHFKNGRDRPSKYLWDKLGERTRRLIEKLKPGKSPSKICDGLMLGDLNPVLWEDQCFFDRGAFGKRELATEVELLAKARPAPQSTSLLRLNRYLMEVAYPRIIARSFRNHIYPHELPSEPEKFDAILLSYVLHTLPHPENREEVLEVCREKLEKGGLLVVASPKYNSPTRQTVGSADEYDFGWAGWVRGIMRNHQTFYSEPKPPDLIDLIERFGFKHPTEPDPLRWDQSTAHVLGFVRR